MAPEDLQQFLDDNGRVTRWPKKRKEKDIILAYLAEKIGTHREYTEFEINEILKQFHTFDDWALLRRELYEAGLLNRTKDGSTYWRPKNVKLFRQD